jgi:predicted nucleic acid-binding protein
MSIVNLVEVYYGYIRDDGLDRADEILAPIYEAPLVIVDTVSPDIYKEVARLKSTLKDFSLADAFGLATAAAYGGTFVTCDHHELDKIEPQVDIPFFWVRPKPEKAPKV